MAPGDVHRFADGYEFVETLHGPNVETSCGSCGDRVYATPEHANDQLCSTCGRRRWGTPAPFAGGTAVPSDRLGQGGVNCYPQGTPSASRLPRGAEVGASRVLMAVDVDESHATVPAGARSLLALAASAGRAPRAVRLATVLDERRGKVHTHVIVAFNGGFCSWRDGRATGGVLTGSHGDLVKLTFTRITGVLRALVDQRNRT